MFREMRRFRQAVSEDECRRVLGSSKRAVLSVIGDDGYPYGIPVNFEYDPEKNKVYVHGASGGHKIDSIKKCDKICFTTWDDGFKKDGDWAWYVTSVIIFGRAQLVGDRDLTEEKCRSIGLKYYPDSSEVEEELRRDVSRVQLIEISIEHMSGKLVHEK